MRKKPYGCYKPVTKDEIDQLILAPPNNPERKLMQKSLRSCKTYLNQRGIYDYQPYISSFLNRGYDSKYIHNVFNLFIDKFKMNWLSKRLFKKANFTEKNIMMNRIVFEYEKEFIEFLINDFPQCLEKPTDFEPFINEFKHNVRKAKNQTAPFIKKENLDSFSNFSDFDDEIFELNKYQFEYALENFPFHY